VEDWAEIRRLHRAEGVPIKEIARRLLLAEWPTVPATVIAERIGWRHSMTTLKDRLPQIRPEELRAAIIKKRNRSHPVRARCTAWAASSCPLVINPEITPSTSAAC
jgi:hypothetical protein